MNQEENHKFLRRSRIGPRIDPGWGSKGRVVMLSGFSCVWLCDPMDYSLPGFSVHEILQTRTLEWVAIPFSRGSSWPRDQTHISMSPALAGGFFTTSASYLTVGLSRLALSSRNYCLDRNVPLPYCPVQYSLSTCSCLVLEIWLVWLRNFNFIQFWF